MNKILSFAKEHKIIMLEVLIVATVFVLTLAQNFLTQFACDDWCYMFIYDNIGFPYPGVKRVQSFADLMLSTKNHWLQWNGRLVPHFLLQLVLTASYPEMMHKVLFNIVNSGMYILLGIIIYKFAIYKNKRSPLLLLCIYAMMWFFIPEYGATILWASGAANYLWTTCIILGFLMPYRKYAVNHENVMRDSVKNAVIMGFLGPIAGCSNENTGCALAFMCMLFVVYYKINKIKIPKWSITGIIGTISGYLFLLLSPGNRREDSITYIETVEFEDYIERFGTIVEQSGELFFGVLMVLSVVLLIVLITMDKDKRFEAKEFYLPLIFIFGAAASVGTLLFSSRFPVRAWFLSVILIIVTISYLSTKINLKAVSKKVIIPAVAVLLVISTISHISAFDAIYGTYLQTEEQEDTIFETLEKRRRNVRIKTLKSSDNRHDIAYKEHDAVLRVSSKRFAWANVWIAEYYGLDTIIAIDNDE